MSLEYETSPKGDSRQSGKEWINIMSDIPKVEFLTGAAGTGKTTEIKNRITKANNDETSKRKYGMLCATTGIAAVNLSSGDGNHITTINSLLRYFDTTSLREAYSEGKLQKSLLSVLVNGANLVIDEVSMMEAEQLDILYLALREVNKLEVTRKRGGLGLVLCGDFCQLPPVKGKFAFEADCWGMFVDYGNLTRLTKVWRQDNLEFLEGLNAARRGDGDKCAEVFRSLENADTRIFHDNIDTHFDGTTIYALNKDVDRLNNTRLLDLLSSGHKKVTFRAFRWGVQKGEWKLIPDELVLAEGAYVMVLANDPPKFDYANGDCGSLGSAMVDSGLAFITLVRNSRQVRVRKIIRKVFSREKPFGESDPVETMSKREYRKMMGSGDEDGATNTYDTGGETNGTGDSADDGMDFVDTGNSDPYTDYLRRVTVENKKGPATVYYDYVEEKWVIGEIAYMPLRLAYASTVHKTQGLTLDRIQLDPSNAFFGSPSMAYVALSRVRSHEGLRIVGGPKLLAERTNVLEDILPWL